MFRKKDILLIGFVLVIAGGIFLWQHLQLKSTQATDTVRIWADGKIYGEYPLGPARDITVTQENGCINVVRITENGFSMHHSSCPNQLCIDQGEVTKDNYFWRDHKNQVLCLPNHVDVELVLAQDSPPPATDTIDPMDLPDI